MQNVENLRPGSVIEINNPLDEDFNWHSYNTEIIERIRYEPVSTKEILRFKYRNWRGDIRDRSVIPVRTTVASSEYHNFGKPCWIMTAFDTEKNELRDFALKDILEYYDIIE